MSFNSERVASWIKELPSNWRPRYDDRTSSTSTSASSSTSNSLCSNSYTNSVTSRSSINSLVSIPMSSDTSSEGINTLYSEEWKGTPVSIYVGGLNARITKSELKRKFQKFGTINKIWVSHNPRRFAFIDFNDDRDANDAIKEMNGTMMKGCRIQVSTSHNNGRHCSQGYCSCRFGNERSNRQSVYRSRSPICRQIEIRRSDSY